VNTFGLIGQFVGTSKGKLKVKIDKEKEESKVQDPFFGLNCLTLHSSEKEKPKYKMYRTDWEIEKDLKLGKGVVNKLTSSMLISYFDKRKMETNVIDLGLNLKNFVKKVHIAEYVRYVSDAKSLAENAYDDYTHNQFARGANHIRKRFEYSQECFMIIKDYYHRFKEVFACV
jgi:hypothetical protein